MLKKTLYFLVMFALIILCISNTSYAQTQESDTFTITITVQYLRINLLDQTGGGYGDWGIGSSIATSSVNSMAGNSWGAGDEGVLVDNESNVATHLQCRVSGDATNWTIGGAIGENTYKLEAEAFTAAQAPAYTFGTGLGTVTLTTSAQDLDPNMPSTTDRYVYLRLTAPSSITTAGSAEQTITVELSVIPL